MKAFIPLIITTDNNQTSLMNMYIVDMNMYQPLNQTIIDKKLYEIKVYKKKTILVTKYFFILWEIGKTFFSLGTYKTLKPRSIKTF